MARIAVLTAGITSTMHSNLALAERLGDSGHEVTFLTDDIHRETVVGEGVDFVGLRADRDAATELARAGRSFRFLDVLWRSRRRTVTASELVGAIDAIGPDVILVDVEARVAIAALQPLGIPVILTTAYFALFEHDGVPPPSSALQPGDPTAIAAAWDELRRTNRQADRRRRFSRRWFGDAFGPVSYRTASAVALSAVARSSGFSTNHISREGWLRPHGFPHLPTMSTNLWELEFPHERPKNWHYIGPSVSVNRAVPERFESSIHRWRDWRNGRADDRPLIYASMGTHAATDVEFVRRIIRSFELRPEWDLVFGLGGLTDVAALGPVPDNVLTLDFAPQTEVLAASDAAIHHAGTATLNECVVAGVPSLVYPIGDRDPQGVAARIEYHGVGIWGDGVHDSPATVSAHITSLLTDSGIGSKVEALERAAASPEVQNRALGVIDEALRRDRRQRDS